MASSYAQESGGKRTSKCDSRIPADTEYVKRSGRIWCALDAQFHPTIQGIVDSDEG